MAAGTHRVAARSFQTSGGLFAARMREVVFDVARVNGVACAFAFAIDTENLPSRT